MSLMGALFGLLSVGFVAGAIVLFVYVLRWEKIVRRIKGLETCPIGSLRVGLCEVKGSIQAPDRDLLTAPVSDMPCVYFHLLVEERRSSGKNSHWKTIIRDSKCIPFTLRDSSGTIPLRLDGAKIHFETDHHGSSGFWDDPSPAFERALAAYGQSSRGWIFNKSLRYKETRLESGDSLYVLGTFQDGTVRKGSDGFFIVSDQGERAVLSRYRLWWLSGSFGVISLSVAAVWFFLRALENL